MADAERQIAGSERQIAGLDVGVLKIALVMVIGAVMSILDTTIVNVALEDISRDLHASITSVQWIVTGYLLALATVIPLAGWMTQRFEPKRLWMSSVALFVAGSVLCGLSSSTGMLIVFRVVQGLGGGLIMPVGMILLTQAAGPKRVGRVMSVIGVPMLLGPVLGPVLGGLIVQSISWRWIFFVNVPVGAVGLVLAAKILPTETTGHAGKLDWLGLLLASPGVALMLFGLSQSSSHGGFGAFTAWGPIAGGLVLLALFVRHALRFSNPLIDLSLFKRPAFSAAAGTIFFVGAALFGALILLPLYFQIARGQSALQAGLLLVPQGVGAAAMMPLSGKLTDRIGGGRVATVGLLLMCAGTVPLAFVTATSSFVWLDAALFVRGLGLGATLMPSMAAAFATLEHSAVPRATSALNTLQRVGGSLGTALLTVVLDSRVNALVPGAAASGGISAAAQHAGGLPPRAAEPVASAFGDAFWVAVGLSLIAVIPAVLLAWKGGRPQDEEEAESPAPESDGVAAAATASPRRSGNGAGRDTNEGEARGEHATGVPGGR